MCEKRGKDGLEIGESRGGAPRKRNRGPLWVTAKTYEKLLLVPRRGTLAQRGEEENYKKGADETIDQTNPSKEKCADVQGGGGEQQKRKL